ncbi:MAG: hypothetical protein WEC84_03390 [Candidatus Andersenbacteria bacterium]
MKRVPLIIFSTATAAILIWLGIYASVLASKAPHEHSLAQYPLWPIACSTRGCVTTRGWQQVHAHSTQFAQVHEQQTPDISSTLTTTVRRHLADHAFLSSPVTNADARRYREEILNVASEEQLKTVVDISLPEYDKQVLVPFLQQEALRQQQQAESADDLYAQLSSERFIIMPLLHFRWDKSSGAAHVR